MREICWFCVNLEFGIANKYADFIIRQLGHACAVILGHYIHEKTPRCT
jgi:hypothetical protein